MLGICFCGCGSDSFVYFGVKPTQRASLRDLLRDQKKTKEGKVPDQNRRREKSTEVNRRGQSREESRS